jgi:hypothetical protein
MAESIDYAKVLEDLEAKRAVLDQMIELTRQIVGQNLPVGNGAFGSGGPGGAIQVGEALRSDSFFGMSAPQACRAYLEMSKQTKTAPEIARAIQQGGIKTTSKNFLTTVHTALKRLAESGELVKVKRGEWGLVEWYPSLRGKGRGAASRAQGEAAQLAGVVEDQDPGEPTAPSAEMD